LSAYLKGEKDTVPELDHSKLAAFQTEIANLEQAALGSAAPESDSKVYALSQYMSQKSKLYFETIDWNYFFRPLLKSLLKRRKSANC
jgi:hypothetical protein